MSRSRPDNFLRNPAVAFISFAGSAEEGKGGFFTYYDKEAEQDVIIQAEDFEFIALEWKLFSVRGFSKPLDAYCYSNEVRSSKDKLVIRNFKSEKSPAGILLEGTYAEMKGDEGTLQQSKKTSALKFNRTVYIVYQGKLFGLHLQGKTFSTWMEDIEKYSTTKMMTRKISACNVESDVNGDVEYTFSNWKFTDEITEEEGKLADAMDEELQKYLDEYLKKNGSTTNKDAADTGEEEAGSKDSGGGKPSTDEWRLYDMDGVQMGKLNVFEITERLNACYEAGGRSEMKDPHYYDCLAAARREYDNAAKTALKATDKGGKPLKDYTEDQLKQTSEGLIKMRPHDPVRIVVEAAWEIKVNERKEAEAKKAAAGEPTDDIPF
jgi:hypothetical protein